MGESPISISQMLLLFKLRSICQPDLTSLPENIKLPKENLLIIYGKNITNGILKAEIMAGDQAEKTEGYSSNPSMGKICIGGIAWIHPKKCPCTLEQHTKPLNAHLYPKMSYQHRGAPCPCPSGAGAAFSTFPVTSNRDPRSESEI